MTHVNLLVLTWDKMFDDADNGWCYAGKGTQVLSVHRDETSAKAFVETFNPVLALAEKESIVFPIQKFNKQLKNIFGLTLDDIDSTGENFKLSVEMFELLP